MFSPLRIDRVFEPIALVRPLVAEITFSGACPGAPRFYKHGVFSVADSRLFFRRASNVSKQELRWLWPGRIPRGKLTLIAGDPGLGKSLVCADIAARVTTGAPWPGEPAPPESERRPPENVWMISCEDDEADTLRPRLDAANADCKRVLFVQGVGTADAKHIYTIRLDRHVAWMEVACEQGDVPALIVIDPITAYLGDVDAHNQAEVRGMLNPLCMLAQKFGIAVVGVMHLNKREDASGVYRISGSLAFPAAARAVWWVKQAKHDADTRQFLPAKFNLGPPPTGLEFFVAGAQDGTPRVQFGEEIAPEHVAAESPTSPEGLGKIDLAKELLLEMLGGGMKEAKDVLRWAAEAGITPSTLARARSELGIIAKRIGGNGPWFMTLPPSLRKQAGVWVCDVEAAPKEPEAA